MASPSDPEVEKVNLLCARMAIDDDDEGLVLDDSDIRPVMEDFRWALIGRFLTEKVIHFVSMQKTLAALWKPVMGCLF